MSEFTPITTQEQLDSLIGDRLKRADEKWSKKFEGYVSPEDFKTKTAELTKQVADLTAALDGANKKAATHDKEISDRDAKIKSYELSAIKHRVAHDTGLSYDSIDFLSGEDEDSIKASAEKLKTLVGGSRQPQAPSFSNEPSVGDGANTTKNAYRSMLKNLNNR